MDVTSIDSTGWEVFNNSGRWRVLVTKMLPGSREPIIDEIALAKHCKDNPVFKAGLDVFEDEPVIHADMKKLSNVTITPQTASSTRWTREGMARLAALNVIVILENYPASEGIRINRFLGKHPPKAIPSIVNSASLKDLLKTL